EDQKLFFEAHVPAGGFRWLLDGAELGDASELLLWTPIQGWHVLTLVDKSDHALDEVTFEVRGSATLESPD
ncbi:MAG: hypothetical protein LBP68_02490, partial [Acidobacteriota bacterium]|nr:hypothetical protein [Acidobacteriota bacterium]